MAVGDYEIDPSLKREGRTGGSPPPLHRRRCQGKNRIKEQCGQWALKGSDYCKWHGGRQQIIKRRKAMSIYSRRATGRLKAILEELGASSDERMSLAGEIDVARTMALDAFKLLNAANEAKGKDGNGASLKSKEAAMALMQRSLKNLSDLVDKNARVTVLLDRTLDAGQVDFLREQILQILENRIEAEHPELYSVIVSDMEKLKLPSKGTVNINVG